MFSLFYLFSYNNKDNVLFWLRGKTVFYGYFKMPWVIFNNLSLLCFYVTDIITSLCTIFSSFYKKLISSDNCHEVLETIV